VTPFLDDAVDAVPLVGGTHHSGWLLTQADGSRQVVKATPGAPAGMFQAEAEGLTVLRDSGAIGAPRVIDVGPGHLAIEVLNPLPGFDDSPFWERLGRALARLHSVRGERFGWPHDNWLGPTRQVNTWTDDCYEFFVRHRVLRYLYEPAVEAALDAAGRAAVERICARLPELVPPSYPALTHGDLWYGNVLAMPDGSPALIDPAVSWSWPEVDLSMMMYAGMTTSDAGSSALGRLFSAYHEIHPPDPGWREHLELIHIRELLCVVSQGRPADWGLKGVLNLIRRYG